MSRRILIPPFLLLSVLVTAAAMASIQKDCDLAKNETPPQLAVNGLDPVLLISGKEVSGLEDFRAVHGGFVYHFASGATRRLFENDPDTYGVQMQSFCHERQDLPGRSNIYLVHEGHIYLFHSERCLDSFQKQSSQCVPL